MRNNIYFRWFWASLSESQKEDYRGMSLNQQKDWYISYLESNYGDRRPGCKVRFPKKPLPPPLPDQGIKLLQEASELVGNPRTIVMGKPDITCISWQEKYEKWLKHSTNILVEVIKCLECGKPSKIPLCFQCFENHYLAHPSRNSGRMNALIRSMIPALKAQQKVGVFGCKDPKEITERLAQEGVIVESEPMLGAKIPRFTHTLEGVEINSIDQKQVGYVFF